jgi:hypothetical protein
MYARVTTAQGSPERVDESLQAIREQGIPVFRQQAGFQHAYFLIDRGSGKGIALTLWDSREALQQAEAALNQMRGQVAQATQLQQPTTEVYEVAFEV